jgi:hypothetical protein
MLFSSRWIDYIISNFPRKKRTFSILLPYLPRPPTVITEIRLRKVFRPFVFCAALRACGSPQIGYPSSNAATCAVHLTPFSPRRPEMRRILDEGCKPVGRYPSADRIKKIPSRDGRVSLID